MFCAFSCKESKLDEKKYVPINGVKITYEEIDQEIADSIAVDSLEYYGIVDLENGIGILPEDTVRAWYRFTVVYSYRQPKSQVFNPDSIYFSEMINEFACQALPHTFYLIKNNALSNMDSTYMSIGRSEAAMTARKIENYKFSYIKNAPYYRVIPISFFDAKLLRDTITSANDNYRAVGATISLNYYCKKFDIDKLLEDPKFKKMVLNRDTSIVLYSLDY
jgi:hypothetical protein